MQRITKSILTLALCLPMLSSATNGIWQIGYGAKSKGMGGVGIALAQDSFASAMNPAGLTCLSCRADVGLHGRLHNITTETKRCGECPERFSAKSDQWDWWPEIGVVWGPLCDQAFGLAYYVAGESRVEYNDRLIFIGETEPLKDITTSFSVHHITPAWAWQLNCTHALGIALNIAFARLKVEGLRGDLNERSIDPERFTNRGANWQEGVSIRFGWTGQFSNCLRLGLTYQTKTWIGHFHRYEGFIPDRGNIDMPGQLGFGVTYTPFCDSVISAEVIKVFWRHGKWWQHELTQENVESFGANDGPGLGWNEQFIFKIGAAWNFNECFTVRAGFNYGNSPVVAGNLLDILVPQTVTQHLTVGATYSWNCWNELSINYIHGRAHEVAGPVSPRGLSAADELSIRSWQRSVGIAYGRVF